MDEMTEFRINLEEARAPAYALPDPLCMANGEPVVVQEECCYD